MWILKSSKGEQFYLIPGEYVVGRRNCEIVLENDQSISRKHAVIVVSHPQNNWTDPKKMPIVEVSDAGSKYGSTLHSRRKSIKMEKNVKHTLKNEDEIQFGLQWNKWTLCFEPLVVLASALPKAQKQLVKGLVGGLGGHVVSEWVAETSHLTMTSITMTVKAICALAYGKPIVSPEYWTAIKKAIDSKSSLPNYEDFIPPLGETVLNREKVSFLITPQRRTLFKGKTFYFFSEPQFKDHGCLVEAAGGVPKRVTGSIRSKKQFVHPNAVVMQLISMNSQSISMSQLPEGFAEIATFIGSEGKRLIPASEIGLAILYCSLEKYCNPDFSFSVLFTNRASENTQPLNHGKLLATATETQDHVDPFEEHGSERKIIPDSGTESKIGNSSSLQSKSSYQGATETQDLSPDSFFTSKVKRTVSATLAATQTQKSDEDSLMDAPSQKIALDSPSATEPMAQSQTDSEESQSQMPVRASTSRNNMKRTRILESDDEIELISPPKRRQTIVKPKASIPVVELDDSNDCVIPSTSSALNISFASSKLNILSDLNHKETSNDNLFDDYEPKSFITTKPAAKMESEEWKDENLLSDFEEDVKPMKTSVCKKVESVPKKVQSVLPFSKLASSVSCATKRSIPKIETDPGPPPKRASRLQASRSIKNIDALMQNDEDDDNDDDKDDIAFLSGNAKKGDENFVSKLSNATVSFKNLMVSRNNTTMASTNSSFDSGVVNYKKFRKVTPHSVMPRIIGGSDLVPFMGASKAVFDVSDESDVEEECNWAINFWGPKAAKPRERSRKL